MHNSINEHKETTAMDIMKGVQETVCSTTANIVIIKYLSKNDTEENKWKNL